MGGSLANSARKAAVVVINGKRPYYLDGPFCWPGPLPYQRSSCVSFAAERIMGHSSFKL